MSYRFLNVEISFCPSVAYFVLLGHIANIFYSLCILSSCYDNYHIIHTFTMVLLDWLSSIGFLRLCVTQKHNLILPFYNYLSTLTVLPARSLFLSFAFNQPALSRLRLKNFFKTWPSGFRFSVRSLEMCLMHLTESRRVTL